MGLLRRVAGVRRVTDEEEKRKALKELETGSGDIAGVFNDIGEKRAEWFPEDTGRISGFTSRKDAKVYEVWEMPTILGCVIGIDSRKRFGLGHSLSSRQKGQADKEAGVE